MASGYWPFYTSGDDEELEIVHVRRGHAQGAHAQEHFTYVEALCPRCDHRVKWDDITCQPWAMHIINEGGERTHRHIIRVQNERLWGWWNAHGGTPPKPEKQQAKSPDDQDINWEWNKDERLGVFEKFINKIKGIDE